MASAMVRSALRNVQLRRTPASSARTFSSSKGVDDAYESAKWEKITYAGITACTILACVILSKGHTHFEEPLHTHTCTFAPRSSHGVLMAYSR